MKWRGWIGALPVVVGLGASGCKSVGPSVSAADPGLAHAVAEAGGGLRPRAHSEEAEPPGPPAPPAGDTQTVAAAGSATVRPAARIRARVNNEVILDEEVRNLIYQDLRVIEELPEPERTKRKVELWKQALDVLIDREVILQDSFAFFKSKGPGGAKVLDKLQEAASKDFEKKVLREVREKYKITSDEELKSFFESQGIDLALLRRHFERNFMAQEFTRHAVYDTLERGSGHAQVLKYYETHPEEFQVEDAVDWQDLFISLNKAGKSWTRDEARRFAEVLAERVRKGEDFVQLCEVHDDGESTLRHAEGRGHKRGEIASHYSPAVEAALFALQEGEVAVVEVDGGFRVVRVVKRQKAGKLEFDEKVQKQIKNKLQNEIYQREVKHFVNELKRKAVIEYSKEAF